MRKVLLAASMVLLSFSLASCGEDSKAINIKEQTLARGSEATNFDDVNSCYGDFELHNKINNLKDDYNILVYESQSEITNYNIYDNVTNSAYEEPIILTTYRESRIVLDLSTESCITYEKGFSKDVDGNVMGSYVIETASEKTSNGYVAYVDVALNNYKCNNQVYDGSAHIVIDDSKSSYPLGRIQFYQDTINMKTYTLTSSKNIRFYQKDYFDYIFMESPSAKYVFSKGLISYIEYKNNNAKATFELKKDAFPGINKNKDDYETYDSTISQFLPDFTFGYSDLEYQIDKLSEYLSK